MSANSQYRLSEFCGGQVEQLIQAESEPKVLLIWQQADENLAPRVGHYIANSEPALLDNVDYICVNPMKAKEVFPLRFNPTGADMSRHFNFGFLTEPYGKQREVGLLEIIYDKQYDYILDVHTNDAIADRRLVVEEPSLSLTGVQRILEASPIRKIAVFPDSIPREGLIDKLPQAVSLEYSAAASYLYGVEETINTIKSLTEGKKDSYVPIPREMYRIATIVSKSEWHNSSREFELNEEGYYPISIGGSHSSIATQTYAGFAATSKTVELI